MSKSSIVPLPAIIGSMVQLRSPQKCSKDELTHLRFVERGPPPATWVLVASEVQDSDLSSYRGIFVDTLPSGRERIKRFNSNRDRREVRAVSLIQRGELVSVEDRVCGCAWSRGVDLWCARDRIFSDDPQLVHISMLQT